MAQMPIYPYSSASSAMEDDTEDENRSVFRFMELTPTKANYSSSSLRTGGAKGSDPIDLTPRKHAITSTSIMEDEKSDTTELAPRQASTIMINGPTTITINGTAHITINGLAADHSLELKSLQPYGSQNKKTEANIFPEPEVEAEADLEKAELAPQSPPVQGGINPADFPDGGVEANLVVLGGWLCLFVSFGWINCIGVFQEYYQEHVLVNYSSSTISWIPSTETFMMFFGGAFAGMIFDNYGPRYLLLMGSVLHVLGLMMTSLSTQYYQIFLAQGVCSALGASAIFYAAMSSVGTWFFRNRATAFGVMASGSSLGGVILPIMVSKLIPRIGFAWTMRAVAFMFLGMLIIANLTVKSRLTPRPKNMKLMNFVYPLKEPAFAILCISSFFFFFGTFLPFNYIILQAQKHGMSSKLSIYLIPILNAASIFGRILPGIIADRFGRFNVMIATTAFSAIVVLALWLPSASNAPILVFCVLYGFSSGAFVSMAPSLIAQISPIREIGVRGGTFFLCVALGGLTGNPIGGALIATGHGDFTWLQLFCGLTMVVGCLGYIAARYIQVGFRAKII